MFCLPGIDGAGDEAGDEADDDDADDETEHDVLLSVALWRLLRALGDAPMSPVTATYRLNHPWGCGGTPLGVNIREHGIASVQTGLDPSPWRWSTTTTSCSRAWRTCSTSTATAWSWPRSTRTPDSRDDVDVVLYDSFAQPESDHQRDRRAGDATRGRATSSSTPGTSSPSSSTPPAGSACTATCRRPCPPRARRRDRGRPRRRDGGQRRRGRRAASAPGLDWPGRLEGITDRESEILALITQGKSNAEVAR